MTMKVRAIIASVEAERVNNASVWTIAMNCWIDAYDECIDKGETANASQCWANAERCGAKAAELTKAAYNAWRKAWA